MKKIFTLFIVLLAPIPAAPLLTGSFNANLFGQSRVYHKINKLKETVEGEKLYSQGRYDEAIAMFKEALKKGETRGEPLFYLGSIHESRHQYEESIPYFEEAVKRELLPEFREATLWKLIILLRKQENYAEVITYIDLLEEFGIKHENLTKFREEAQINLSPEKIKSRLLIKDAKKTISDWEADHKDHDFWTTTGIDDLRKSVLEKYAEAVSLDDSLFNLYWDIADYYEKMSNTAMAVQIYEKIISRNQDIKAYYKIGVICRKNGDFPKAREYFSEALKNPDESNSVRYYLLVNLSQVLYALGDFENGIRYSKEAQESNKQDDPFYDNLIYCLHLSGSGETPEANQKRKAKLASRISQLKNKCVSFAGKTDLAKKDIRLISLYHYMLGEVNAALSTKQSTRTGGKSPVAVENYAISLIPPILRDASLKGLKVHELPESYEDSKWAPLPLWCLVRLDHVAAYFDRARADRELYLTLLIYKKYLKDKNPDSYNASLAVAASKLGLNEDSIIFYQQIKDRNFESEKGLLKIYLRTSAVENFQNEISSYLRLHPQAAQDMRNFLTTDPDAVKIPQSKLTPEIKALMENDDTRDNEYRETAPDKPLQDTPEGKNTPE